MHRLYIFIILLICSFPLFATESKNCGNNEQANILSKLIIDDAGQQRKTIRCNKILMKVAEAKAKKMAEVGLVRHNLGGGPNSQLRNAGYKLPVNYGNTTHSNQIEAIAGGYSDADDVWYAFKHSKGHRTHLLGEHEFYLEQDEIGVAFIKKWKSPHVEYWVVYLTKGYEENQKYLGDPNDIPNKSLLILEKKTAK